MRAKLTEGSIKRGILRLAIPMTIGIASVVAFNFIDTLFIAKLGTTELASISFTFPVIMLLTHIALGLGVGASSIISRSIGQGKHAEVKRLTTDSIYLVLLIAALFSTIGIATISPLFRLIGAEEIHIGFIKDYMVLWYLSLPFIMFSLMGNSAMRAVGDAMPPAMVMLIFTFVNLALDPLFIFGLWGFPAMGVKGAAVATFISYACAALVVGYLLHQRKKMLSYKVTPNHAIASWKQILHVGLPASVNNIIQPLSQAIIIALIAGFGSHAVAAYGIVTRIEALCIVVYMALTASLVPFVGQNDGANLYARIGKAMQKSYRFVIFWGLAAALLLVIASGWIIGWFTDDALIADTAQHYLWIVPISYATLGMAMITGSYFNGKGEPLPAFLITFTRSILLLLPLAFILSHLWQLHGIFYAILATNLIVGTSAYVLVTGKVNKAAHYAL